MWHRQVFEIHYQMKIPPGICICHHCDNTRCINPDHMFLGTYKDNFDDARLKGRLRWAVGEAHGRAVLNPDKVREIRKDLDAGMTIKAVAGKFNVGNNTIFRIKHNLTWKHVENES
jgi:hypothetical protein